MIQTIYDHYGIKPAQLTDIGEYKGFQYRSILYIIVDLGHLDEEEVYEFHQMSQFLISQGERKVASFMINKDGGMITESDGKKFGICRVPYPVETSSIAYGRELAAFHQKGKLLPYPMEKSNRIGQWKGLWEKRLDQLEKFWGMKVQEHPNNETDKRFIESFPYYLGVTENAIQYLTDTEIDDLPRTFDIATICHHRFILTTWRQDSFFKMPTDWVFDHPSRDLAEYIRHLYFKSGVFSEKVLFDFLGEYEKITPLSSFAWRLLYARLLFPVHYFESIEGYYSSRSEAEKQTYESDIEKIIHGCTQYEQFLAYFYSKMGISTKRHHIPEIEWLQ
ncbi:spore coat protein YutH [Bacillus fengqiuensis]|nr:spore coat protein YutH [Bacillus fengqiuensis]